MSADHEIHQVIRSIVALNDISRSTYGSVELVEVMKESVFTLITNMVEVNRQYAMRPPIIEAHKTKPIPRKKIPATKALSKKQLEEACPCECAICNETPAFKDAIYTECGHYYCGKCWASWMNSPNSNKKCPTCRKDMPKTTSYKARACRKQNTVIEV